MTNKEKLVKLNFNLPEDWHGVGSESLWAEKTFDNKLLVRNTPFYVKGVSFMDKVDFYSKDNNLFFNQVVEKGGHSTYRISRISGINVGNFELYWKPIQNLGCSYESKSGVSYLYAVDIPLEVNVNKVYELLQKEEDNIWSFEEAGYYKKLE